MKSVKILVANGVNLDLLGRREKDHYGTASLSDIQKDLQDLAPKFAEALNTTEPQLTFFQSNVESEFLSMLSKEWNGALINPGAWTHTSLALGDRLAALKLPFIEIHLSNLARRESFRHNSYAAPHALGTISGLEKHSYSAGLFALMTKFANNKN